MDSQEGLAPPPPPPPPLSSSSVPTDQEDQHYAFSALKQLGYPVEKVSPWKLVTELLRDVVKGNETLEAERREFELLLEQERKRTEKAERDKLAVLKEVARKIQENEEEKNEEKRIELLQDALFERGDASSRALAETLQRNKRLEVELARVRSSLAECQTECQRLASVASYASTGKETAFGELEEQTQARSETEKLVSRLNQLLESEKASNRSVLEELDQLRIELIKLEGVRDGLQHKLERAAQTVQTCQESKHKVEETLEQAREETRATTDMLMEERRSRKALKVRLDECERDLRLAREEFTKQQSRLGLQERTKLELEQQAGVLKRQIAAQAEALSTRDDELRQALTKVESLEMNLEDEKKAHATRLQEVRAAALDVANMSRENREVSTLQERTQKDLRETKAALEEARAKIQRFAGMLDAAKLERAELLTVYRKVCDENSQMSQDLKNLSDVKQDLQREERSALDQVAELTHQVNELDLVNKKLTVELESTDRRVEGLTRELRASRAKCESLEEGKTLADRASQSEQQRYSQAARQHDALRWELDQTKQELGTCAQRLDRALEENARLAEQLVSERIKQGELESQVERARIGQAKALISSGQAFASTDRLRTPAAAAANARSLSPDDGEESSLSTLKDFEDRFEELERVMGDDELSEASSVIRRTREQRARATMTPGLGASSSSSRRGPAPPPPSSSSSTMTGSRRGT